MKSYWEHFEHEADIGVRGVAETLEFAFEQAAVALTAIITDPTLITPKQSISIKCEAPDLELLFVDWLNALIYEMATKKLLFNRYNVTIVNGVLSAHAWGEPVDREKHQPVVEVKGATYTELKVYQNSMGAWIAQCVVDV